jgi:integrase
MREPKPFFRKQTKTWYVQIGKKQHNLGPDEEVAKQKYHALMSGRQPITDDTIVYAVLFQFLGWDKQHREKSTHEFYKRHIVSFAEYVGEMLTVGELKPFHVTNWLDQCYPKSRVRDGKKVTGVGDNYRRSAVRSVQRAFNWAVEQGYLKASPIAKLKKPAYKPRDVILAPEQWAQLVAALEFRGANGRAFLDLLTLMRHTGCRPLEARKAEARHFDRKNRCLVFERHESKGHGGEKTVERRVVPLSDTAFEICQRQAMKYPTGPLLRNTHGTPWTAYAMKEWFKRLDGRRYKVPSPKRVTFRISAYAIRHTWATEALERSVDPITVATIMGHKDLTMLMKVYQHIEKKKAHLRTALHQALGETAPVPSSVPA